MNFEFLLVFATSNPFGDWIVTREKISQLRCGNFMLLEKIFGCPPGIRTPISRSRICCPTIERGGNSR